MRTVGHYDSPPGESPPSGVTTVPGSRSHTVAGTCPSATSPRAVLNAALRPVLARWHPELLANETQRPAGESPVACERTWPHAGELDTTHHGLLDYAEVADVPPLHVGPHGPANNWP
jgi:hypothetical protein